MNDRTAANTNVSREPSPKEIIAVTAGTRLFFAARSWLAALNLLAVAILLEGSIINAPAIGIRNRNGAIFELGSLSGTVSHVDQNRHRFTLTWRGKGMLKMERYWPSYQEDYQVTDSTLYKNGSWADIQKGVHVRIAGQSYEATFVEFTK